MSARPPRLRPAGRHHVRRLLELPRRGGPLRAGVSAGQHGDERADHDSRVPRTSPTSRCLRRCRCGKGPTGWSAKCGTCSASASRPSRLAANPDARGVHRLSAAQGLPVAGPRRAAQFPGLAPGRRLNEPCWRDSNLRKQCRTSSASALACASGSWNCSDRVLNMKERHMAVVEPKSTVEDLAKAEAHDYLWTLNFGPQHPATHTTLRLVLKLDGERVVDAMPDIGYLHSGFEKLGEHLNYNQYVTVTDRMNYISPMANNVAWHGAVEKLLGPRADAPLQVHPHDRRRAVADQRPPAVQRRRGARHRRVHLLSLRLLPARGAVRHLRDALRRAVHQQLHPRRRADVRRHAAGRRKDSRFPAHLSQNARRHGAAAQSQPHLRRSHQGRRRADQGRGHQPQRHRADRPGQRRDPRPAQGRAVPGVQGFRFPGVLRDGRRLLCPLPGADGRDAREPEDRRAGDRESSLRAGERRRRRAHDAARQGARFTRRSRGRSRTSSW